MVKLYNSELGEYQKLRRKYFGFEKATAWKMHFKTCSWEEDTLRHFVSNSKLEVTPILELSYTTYLTLTQLFLHKTKVLAFC